MSCYRSSATCQHRHHRSKPLTIAPPLEGDAPYEIDITRVDKSTQAPQRSAPGARCRAAILSALQRMPPPDQCWASWDTAPSGSTRRRLADESRAEGIGSGTRVRSPRPRNNSDLAFQDDRYPSTPSTHRVHETTQRSAVPATQFQMAARGRRWSGSSRGTLIAHPLPSAMLTDRVHNDVPVQSPSPLNDQFKLTLGKAH